MRTPFDPAFHQSWLEPAELRPHEKRVSIFLIARSAKMKTIRCPRF